MKGDKKVWGWWILYFVLILLGLRLAGIGGIIGAALISFGLNKTIRNPLYSKGKKISYSILYIIAGVLVGGIIAFVLLWGLIKTGVYNPETSSQQIDQSVQSTNQNTVNQTNQIQQTNPVTTTTAQLKTIHEEKNDTVPAGEFIGHKFSFDKPEELHVNITTNNQSVVLLMTQKQFDDMQKNPNVEPQFIQSIREDSVVVSIEAGRYVILIAAGDKMLTYSLSVKIKQ